MSDLGKSAGNPEVPLRRGPAALAYNKAQDIEDLQVAAGEHLCLRAVAIMQSLQLPVYGSLVLKEMRRLSPPKWQHYWQVNNDAFCACALIELLGVRHIFQQAKRWPELSSLLDQTFIMASVYLGRSISMDAEETTLLREQAATHLIDFQDHLERTHTEQVSRVLDFACIGESREKKALFIQRAIIQPAHLEPLFLIQEYDRISRNPREGIQNDLRSNKASPIVTGKQTSPSHTSEAEAQPHEPFRPDYGIRLVEQGFGSKADHFFYSFRLYSLTVLSPGEFSTMVDWPYQGKVFALSLDFNQAILDDILRQAPPDTAEDIRNAIQNARIGSTIDFNDPVSFGVRARLGKLQSAEKEQFIPLVAQEILRLNPP